MAKTLQGQGVPIPSKLSGPGGGNGPQSRTSTPSRTSSGSTPRRSSGRSSQSVSNRQSGSSARPGSVANSIPSPTEAGGAVSGVGLLEAEFILAIILLVLLLFADDSSTLTEKMMSTMKRGTLLCALFFILALVSGIGPRASKSAKAFGALVIVAILITSPIYKPGQNGGQPTGVLPDIDNLIKNEWVGEVPQDPNSSGGSNGPEAGGSSGAFGAAERAALASIGDADTIGKLLNPADEAKGTINTLKAIGDTLTGIVKSFL